jgi:VWFA-related protein
MRVVSSSGAVAFGALVALAAARSAAAPQQPVFRQAVDLIAVDAQVVDRNGNPLLGLRPDQFEVSLNGRRRRVVLAEFVRTATSSAPVSAGVPAAAPARVGVPTAGPGRIFMLAIDVNSFGIGESRGVVQAAQRFLRRLPADDLSGLYVFPIGPHRSPTSDRADVLRLLGTVVGNRQSLSTRFKLSPSEIVDITAESAGARMMMQPQGGRGAPVMTLDESGAIARVLVRECRSTDVACLEDLELEASSMAFVLEGQLAEAASGLQSVLRDLGELPGRKTLVLVSGGMPASDRAGGRPDAGELAKAIGQSAARANTTIYALHVDSTAAASMSPENMRGQTASHGRDSFVSGLLLDQLAGSSGGTLMHVSVGSGEGALDQVLRETSSHYLLGVEPAADDRDGELHRLQVKVNAPGATVRSRLWVMVPEA